MSNKIANYLVVGNPISHSKSPSIHAMFAKQTQQDISYEAQLVDLDKFSGQIDRLNQGLIDGFNITVPFKEEAYASADILSKSASLAGAVNTLTFRNNKIHGDNTDGVGLVRDLTENHDFDFKGKKVLILGAGGAVRGIIEPIIKQQPQSITISNRTVSKAQILVEVFSELFDLTACSYEDLDQPFDLIINGTSASLHNQVLPIPESVVNSTTYLYDMMYSSQQTLFNSWGLGLGASKAFDGLGMLVEQAAESFFIWRCVRPETQPVIVHMRNSLK